MVVSADVEGLVIPLPHEATAQPPLYPVGMYRHVIRCLIAGVVALLPIGGTILGFFYLESVLSGPWRADLPYFPGLGLLVALVLLYVVGLFVTTFLGRWLFHVIDRAIRALPVAGEFYQTLKQILGYGSGEDAVFQQVVLVPSTDTGGVQVGLVTRRGDDGRCAVFLPGSPNPTAGRLVFVDEADLEVLDEQVADALKVLVSVGKGPFGVG